MEIARRTLRSGFWYGFALGCGAVTVDVSYALLSSLSLGRWATQHWVRWPLALGGFVFLLYLGAQSLRSAAAHLKADPLSAVPVDDAGGRSYRTGVLMTLLNPITLVFWFVELPSQGAIMQDPRRDMPMICAGVFLGTLGWVVVFSGFLACLGRWRKNWWLAAADGLGGIMLLSLAILGLWHVLRQTL